MPVNPFLEILQQVIQPFFINCKFLRKMETKKLTPIVGVDPVADFVRTLPGTASILGCKGSRSAEKSEISLVYLVNGQTHYAHCSFSIGNWEGGAI